MGNVWPVFMQRKNPSTDDTVDEIAWFKLQEHAYSFCLESNSLGSAYHYWVAETPSYFRG